MTHTDLVPPPHPPTVNYYVLTSTPIDAVEMFEVFLPCLVLLSGTDLQAMTSTRRFLIYYRFHYARKHGLICPAVLFR